MTALSSNKNFIELSINLTLEIIYFLGDIAYFRTGRGNKGLRIDNYMYKRHYETTNSVYWICTLSNKYKCKQRVIAEMGKPFNIRFKGPGHNHSLRDYQSLLPSQKASVASVKSMFDAHQATIKEEVLVDSE